VYTTRRSVKSLEAAARRMEDGESAVEARRWGSAAENARSGFEKPDLDITRWRVERPEALEEGSARCGEAGAMERRSDGTGAIAGLSASDGDTPENALEGEAERRRAGERQRLRQRMASGGDGGGTAADGRRGTTERKKRKEKRRGPELGGGRREESQPSSLRRWR
jgi:hypothetical protein